MRMKKIKRIVNASCLLSLALLSACSTVSNKAPVVERTSLPVSEVIPVAPVAKPVVKNDGGKGMYVVKRGDTLYRIALDHGQSYSDLVAWNNLKNPNDIKVDQVLRVLPPDAAGVNGVQAVPVSPVSAIEVKPLGANVSGNKTSPRGDKRPYSEANLAELQKADAISPPVAVKSDAVVPVKLPEKGGDQSQDSSEVLDWMWPVDGKVIAGFDDAKNKGLDISGRMGQDVFAAGAGKVMYAGSGIRGYGNLVIIKHNNSLLSAYAHNKAIVVKEGQTIAKGQKIAEMGNSDSENVKLHFEIRLQGKPVDPARYLPSR